MKISIHFYIWLVLILGVALPDQSFSAPRRECAPDFSELSESASALRNFDKVVPKLRENELFKKIKLTKAQVQRIEKEANALGIEVSGLSKNFSELMNEIIAKTHKLTGLNHLDKAQKLAELAKRLDTPVISKLSKDNKKTVDFAFGLAITRTEAFRAKDYEVMTRLPFNLNSKTTVVPFSKYLELTKRYLKGDTAFLDDKGVISGRDIRDMEIHNRFPAYIDHDMRHIHFGTSHPRAVAVMFTTARSKNHSRSVLMSAAYEAVDTVQYSEESAIAKYFRTKKKMNIEEGMVYISRATNEELEKIMEGTGHAETFKNYVEQADKLKRRTTDLKLIPKMDKEVDDMIDEFLTYPKSRDPATKDALIYNKNPTPNRTNDERKNHY